jgi:hypothetical protein
MMAILVRPAGTRANDRRGSASNQMSATLLDVSKRNQNDASFSYSLFGLQIVSNQPIPGLIPTKETTQVFPETAIVLGSLPNWDLSASHTNWYTSDLLDEFGQPNLIVSKVNNGFSFEYCDGINFVVEENGNSVWATWPDEMTLEDTVVYLVGPVLGFVLRLKGITCLHASAVVVNDLAVVFAGSQGTGKSTLAAAFANLGYAVMSDDVTALACEADAIVAQPAYPRVRLWPGSVNELFGSENALPLLTPNWDKRYLDLTQEGYRFHDTPLPVGAIYVLGDHSHESATVSTTNMPAATGLLQLLANTYCGYLIGKGERAEEFEFLSRVASSIPIRMVRQGSDFSRPSDLCDVILKDFEQSISEAGTSHP